jgi:hypothetical protein
MARSSQQQEEQQEQDGWWPCAGERLIHQAPQDVDPDAFRETFCRVLLSYYAAPLEELLMAPDAARHYGIAVE